MASPAATPALGPQDDGSNLWEIEVGGMDVAEGIDTHAFYPTEITIAAGDTIWFNFTPMGMPMFHTVTFTSGEEVPPIIIPDMQDGTPVANDDGTPRFLINPALAFPDGRTDYDGTGMVNSGLDVFRTEEQGPYLLTFTTPGDFEYQCGVHLVVMKGKVHVLEAGAELPLDTAGVQAAADAQRAALLEEGRAALAAIEPEMGQPSAEDPHTWNVAAGVGEDSQARVMKFVPRELTIKVGDTVRWVNHQVGEPHTITFLGGTEPPEDVLVEPQASGQPVFVQNTATLLPAGGAEYDGTGYHNSGFYGLPPDVSALFGLPTDGYSLTFTAAGEFPYYCILHSGGPDDEVGMAGKVIVEA
jgi:plastocyanin